MCAYILKMILLCASVTTLGVPQCPGACEQVVSVFRSVLERAELSIAFQS